MNQKKAAHSIPSQSDFSTIKQIVWNKLNSFFAIVCKRAIYVYTKNFAKVCQFSEKFNIKSLIWKDDLLVFSTLNHLKYGLLNGEEGIIKCQDNKQRIVQLDKNVLVTIDSTGKILQTKIDTEEFLLKQALFDKNYEKTQQYLAQNKKLGNSTIAYLYRKNYCALAMNLVTDQRAKFSLAIDSGNLEVAYKTCSELKDKELYRKLAEEALNQGNHQLLDIALQQVRGYEQLSFLYLTLGKQDKLEKMLKIAQSRSDNMSRFHNSLYLGDVQERVKLLAEIGQTPLAYLTAVAHGIESLADPLLEQLEDPAALLQELRKFESFALLPPSPLIKNLDSSPQSKRNWPHNYIPEENALIASKDAEKVEEIRESAEDQVIVEEQSKQEFQEISEKTNFKEVGLDEDEEAAWPIDDDMLVEDNTKEVQQQNPAQTQEKRAQWRKGENPVLRSAQASQHIADQCAIGYFENAFALLKK